MAYSFKSNAGRKAFKLISGANDAGNYTYNKMAEASYCVKPACPINVKVGSQGNYILFNRARLIKASETKCGNSSTFDKTQLYINLVTKLDLSGNLPIITDLSFNPVHPVSIDDSVAEPYLKYNIDPSGVLFGNTVCGINNFVEYMIYDTQPTTSSV